MAIECTAEEAWKELSSSNNSEDRRCADLLFPEYSIQHEMDLARRSKDNTRVIKFGQVIAKYFGPKMDSYRSVDHAYRALLDIRAIA